MRSILLSLLIFSSTFVKAQLFGVIPINKFQKGYYYDLNNQKIVGKIAKDASTRNAFANQNYILFKSDTASGRVKITPDMIKAFVVDLDSFTVSRGDNAQFFRVVFDGPSKIFTVSEFGSRPATMVPQAGGGGMMMMAGGGPSKTTSYFHGPDADHITPLTKKNYIEVMSTIMADEPYIADLIKDKTYRFADMKDLIEAYRNVKLRRSKI